MALALLFFAALAAAQTCKLRLVLSDKSGDGWNGNFVTLGSDPGITLNVLESGNCGYSDSTVNAPNSVTVTLVLTSHDSFEVDVPYGASLTVNYTGTVDPTDAPENSWLVELWDVRAPYGEVVLLSGGPYVGVQTSTNTVAKVTCGPTPVCAVGTITVGTPTNANAFSAYVSDISWSGAFVDSTQTIPTQYYVSWCDPSTGVDCSVPDNYKNIGRTSSNHLQAIFPPGGTYQLSVEAFNEYGLAPSILTSFSTQGGLQVSQVTVVVHDSYGDGWPDDGYLLITLNGIRFAHVGFPCSASDVAAVACKSLTYQFYAPAEMDLIFEANFFAPSASAQECSFTIILGPTQLDSGLDALGPAIRNFVYPINLPTTPYAPPPAPTATYTTSDCANDITSSSQCATIDFTQVSAGGPCTVPGISCRSTTACGACNSSSVWTCQATQIWSLATGCSCAQAPACASFQSLTTTDCCKAGLTCVNDATSEGCNGPTPWGECIVDSGTCGSGTQYRNNYVKTDCCTINTESQKCEVPCPVDCVGAWSGWSACTSTCGSGYQSNTYQYSVFPCNGGHKCPYAHGELDYQQCAGLPDCDGGVFMCHYELEQYDTVGDGWGALTKLQIAVGTQDPITVGYLAPDASLTYHLQVTPFDAPSGSVVNLNLISNNDPDLADDSYSVHQVLPLPGDQQIVLKDIIYSPPNLNLDLLPTSTQFTAFCANCANLDCLSKHRVPCEYAQVADLTCGPCLSGYGLPSGQGDRTQPGTNTCVAQDACATGGNDYCSQSHQTCQLVSGGYQCNCNGNLINGQCVSVSPVGLLQRESKLKRDLRWASQRLQHQNYIHANPAGSFAELESRMSESARLGMIPTSSSAGFYMTRCSNNPSSTNYTCDPSNPLNPKTYFTNSAGQPIFLGDDYSDNIFWNYLPGNQHHVPVNGVWNANAPEAFRTDGSTFSYQTYPSYGRKSIWPSSDVSKPFGTLSTTMGNTWTQTFQQDPNSCCWAIKATLKSTAQDYYWNVVAGTNQVLLTPFNAGSMTVSQFYLWAFWDNYPAPATTTTTTTQAPTTAAPTQASATTAAPTTQAPAGSVAPTSTTSAAPTTSATATSMATGPPASTQVPTQAPTAPPAPCGAWNQSCCSPPNACGSNLTCDSTTYTCQVICPKRTRKEWQEMSVVERDRFVRGVRILAGLDPHPSNPTGSNYFAYTRKLHSNASVYGDYYNVHNNVHFLPWHRFFLWDLERKMNSIGQEWACMGWPYWDWTKVSVSSSGVLNLLNNMFTNAKDSTGKWTGVGQIDGNTAFSPGHPFPIQTQGCQEYYACTQPGNTQPCYWYGAEVPPQNAFPGTWQWNSYGGGWTWAATYAQSAIGRSTAIFSQANINNKNITSGWANGGWAAYGPYTMYQQVLSAGDYNTFNNQVNSYGHQAVHVWVNGFMSNLQSAANDPVFFLVHAFVDALWAAWQQCNGLIPLPADYQTNSAYNNKVWNWNAPQTFEGASSAMPFFATGRAPKDAFDINLMGYQYTSGFITNVINLANSNFCSNEGSSFVNPSFLSTKETLKKKHPAPPSPVLSDPNNLPKVVATNFLESYKPVNLLDLSVEKPKKSNLAKAIAAAKRKRALALALATLSKPACYQPTLDEINNMKGAGNVLKKYTRAYGADEGNKAVADHECGSFQYTSGLVVSPQFAESMGSMAIKRRAQGAYHHGCYLRQYGKKGDSLKSQYEKDLEKKHKQRKPRNAVVPKPSPTFKCVEDGAPPPQGPPVGLAGPSQPKKSLFQKSEQNALGPM